MKMFRNIVIVFALMAMLPLQNFAQKTEKNRCNTEICVLEVLKKLNSDDKTVVLEAERFVDSIANDVLYTGDSDTKMAILNSITQFVHKFENCPSNAFLISLLPKVTSSNDLNIIMQLLDNEKYADNVIRALGEIKGADATILKYIFKHKDDLSNKAAWAYAVGKQNITELENELISWLNDADDKTKIEIYKALLVIKTNDNTTKIILKGAKKLRKSPIAENQIAGLQLITAIKGEKAMSMLYKALKNDDKKVRRAVLELMKPFANQDVKKRVLKKCFKDEPLVDAIDWLGDIKDETHVEFLIQQLSSTNPSIVKASIRALLKIDNVDGINAVKQIVGGKFQEDIKEAMIDYAGDYRVVMNDLLKNGNDIQRLGALDIIESRPIVGVNTRVKELLFIENQRVSEKAFKVLKLVVDPAQAEYLMNLLSYCDDKYVEDVQLAIKQAMSTLPDERKDMFAATLKHVKPEIMPRYYNVFAYLGTESCVDKLIDAYKNGDYKFEAKEALLLIDNEQFANKIQEALKD